jgi:hypothetical protein
MRNATVATVLVLVCVALPTNAQTKSEPDFVLSMRGLGPVRLGMTVREASASARVPLKKISEDAGCKFAIFLTGDAYFYVGVKDGRIQAACAASKRVSTTHGIRKGDSQKKLTQFPRTSLKIESNHYELKPTDPQDRGYIMWFEVQGGEIDEICAATPALHAHVIRGGC